MIIFRLPFDDKILTVLHESENTPLSFVSFDEKTTIKFRGKITEIAKENLENDQLFGENPFLDNYFSENKADYLTKIEEVIRFLKLNQLPKLVISRIKEVSFDNSPINLSKSFLNLCQNYENAFVYAFQSENQCWIGAFSELLGKFDKKTGRFETMSLAGTLPLDEKWTEKEIQEQKTVTDYIKKILQKYSQNLEISQLKDHKSGNIKHLRTDFSAQINPENLEKVISELHPTPAVCGIPKDLCKAAIKNFENHSRELYAGYSRTETEDHIYWFVNLRCAKILKNRALLYVGGGITQQSNPEKEWQETELKAQAILKNLAIS